MPTVRKRIEALERCFAPIQELPWDDEFMGEALSMISDEELENLEGAGEAQTQGRPLTPVQMAAQRALARAVAQCRFPGSGVISDERS